MPFLPDLQVFGAHQVLFFLSLAFVSWVSPGIVVSIYPELPSSYVPLVGLAALIISIWPSTIIVGAEVRALVHLAIFYELNWANVLIEYSGLPLKSFGPTILHLAAHKGNLNAVIALLEGSASSSGFSAADSEGLDVNTRVEGVTALEVALTEGHEAVAAYLMKRPGRDLAGALAAVWPKRSSLHDILIELAEEGATTSEGDTAFMLACREGDFGAAYDIRLHNSPRLRQTPEEESLMLEKAFEFQRELIVADLAKLKFKTTKGQSAITLAMARLREQERLDKEALRLQEEARKRQERIDAGLIDEDDEDEDGNGTAGGTPPAAAAAAGANAAVAPAIPASHWADLATQLILHDTYMPLHDKEHLGPLLLHNAGSNTAAAEKVLQIMKNENATHAINFREGDGRPNRGPTALFQAVNNNHAGLVKQLLEAGADKRLGYLDLSLPQSQRDIIATHLKELNGDSVTYDQYVDGSTAERRHDYIWNLVTNLPDFDALRARHEKSAAKLAEDFKDGRLKDAHRAIEAYEASRQQQLPDDADL